MYNVISYFPFNLNTLIHAKSLAVMQNIDIFFYVIIHGVMAKTMPYFPGLSILSVYVYMFQVQF